jgi:hypothetical protein
MGVIECEVHVAELVGQAGPTFRDQSLDKTSRSAADDRGFRWLLTRWA